MDYRNRYPEMTQWSYDRMANWRKVFPFNPIKNISIFETFAPDDQTTFLGIMADTRQERDYTLSSKWYFIESSADCPNRKAFVLGELTWEEFWTSRPWLIELSWPDVMQLSGLVQYVPAVNILRDLKRTFQEVNHKSPLVLKHETLKLQIEWEFESLARKRELQLELQHFENQYGRYLIPKAA